MQEHEKICYMIRLKVQLKPTRFNAGYTPMKIGQNDDVCSYLMQIQESIGDTTT